jgi:hypothetical protein
MKPALAKTLVAGAFGIASLAAATDASAYCRSKACDNVPSYEDVWQEMPDPSCKRDGIGCLLAGTPLFWAPRCISYTIQKDGAPSEGIPFETINEIVNQAFETWKAADCGGGARPSITVENMGPVSCRKAEYNQNHPNANIVTFRETSWPRTADHPLALTTTTYNTETAEIYDVDIEINSFGADFSTTNELVPEKFDLLSVLTHEVGHFLGLSHSSGTTMHPFYSPSQRTLTLDDMAGICEIYPPGRTVDEETCDPRHGFSAECAPPPKSKGCAVAKGRQDATGLVLLVPLALAWGLRRRPRRKRSG